MNEEKLKEITEDPKFSASLELLRRTGASSFQVRYSDDEDPVVWIAVAGFGEGVWESGCGPNPLLAMQRLLAQLIDGGVCRHCRRPAGFEPSDITKMPFDGSICWYQWDPELKKYRRSCEGSDA